MPVDNCSRWIGILRTSANNAVITNIVKLCTSFASLTASSAVNWVEARSKGDLLRCYVDGRVKNGESDRANRTTGTGRLRREKCRNVACIGNWICSNLFAPKLIHDAQILEFTSCHRSWSSDGRNKTPTTPLSINRPCISLLSGYIAPWKISRLLNLFTPTVARTSRHKVLSGQKKIGNCYVYEISFALSLSHRCTSMHSSLRIKLKLLSETNFLKQLVF